MGRYAKWDRARTRIVHLTEDKDAGGPDFLGFHHWPSA